MQSIKWMLRPDSPLYVKPSVVPGMLGWLLEFWRHCNVEKYEQGRSALGMLNRLSLRDFDRLAEQGLDFEMHSAGLLYVFRTEEALRAYLDDLAHWEEFGASEPKRLTPDEARELEPALRPEIIGGLLVESERHVPPKSCCPRPSSGCAPTAWTCGPTPKSRTWSFRTGASRACG